MRDEIPCDRCRQPMRNPGTGWRSGRVTFLNLDGSERMKQSYVMHDRCWAVVAAAAAEGRKVFRSGH